MINIVKFPVAITKNKFQWLKNSSEVRKDPKVLKMQLLSDGCNDNSPSTYFQQ